MLSPLRFVARRRNLYRFPPGRKGLGNAFQARVRVDVRVREQNGDMDAVAPLVRTEMPPPSYIMSAEGYQLATYSWGEPDGDTVLCACSPTPGTA